VTFNEDEFPLRDVYQPNSTPSSLLEPPAGILAQAGVGGDWGRAIGTVPASESGALKRPVFAGERGPEGRTMEGLQTTTTKVPATSQV
jgi:hypothetical protein